MRERTIRVDTEKLQLLSQQFRPSKVASKLGISKQRWRNYEKGKNDIPESILNRICETFDIKEQELAIEI